MFAEDGAIRLIEGPDAGDAPAVDGDFDVEPDVVSSKFQKFVREFAYSTPGTSAINVGTMKYRDQFQQNCSAGYHYLDLNLNDLNSWEDGGVLSHKLHNNPTEFVPLCERALQSLYREFIDKDIDRQKVPYIQLQLSADVDLDGTFGTMQPKMIRDLTTPGGEARRSPGHCHLRAAAEAQGAQGGAQVFELRKHEGALPQCGLHGRAHPIILRRQLPWGGT